MTEYQKFLTKFIERGYEILSMSTMFEKKNQLMLRHDIDFSIPFAYQIACQEAEINVKSSFFFLLRSKAYNIFELENFKLIKKIHELGHKISVHFDASLYDNVHSGLQKELDMFSLLGDSFEKIELVSIHRPKDGLLGSEEKIQFIEHTYMPKYFRDIAYFADSGGSFKYGNSLESEAFKQNDTIHLLIHPIWWVEGDFYGDAMVMLDKFRLSQDKAYLNFMVENCIPYQIFMENK